MKKISTLAIALIAMGSLATPVSAQNIMPKVSTEGGATYTYYLQGAGKASSCYASKEVGSDNNVQFTKDKTKRLQVKLVASASNYNIVTTNLETVKYIGCNNTNIAPNIQNTTNGYVRYYDDAATNAVWVVAKNTSSAPADMNNYYPYYAIKPSANNNASWNAFGGVNAKPAQVRLHGQADQGGQWNFIPADVATLNAWADDAKAEIDALTTTADKNDVLTAIQAAQSATEADVDSKATNLLSAYTKFFKQVKLATIDVTEIETDYNAHKGQAGYPTESSFEAYKTQIQSVTISSTYDQIANVTNTAASAITEVNMPADGKVYVFVNVHKDGIKRYLDYDNDQLKVKELSGKVVNELPSSAKFVCRVVDGNYMFVNNDGKYLVWAAPALRDNKGTNSGKGYIAAYEAKWADLKVAKSSVYGCLNIGGLRSEAQENKNAQQSYFIVKNNGALDGVGTYSEYNTDTYSSIFRFEEVSYPNTIAFNTVSDVEGVKSIATFSAPFATVIPEGVTAYYVSTADNSTATMKAITGKAIPANEGVILTYQSGDAVTMVPATNETLATIENNKLGNSAGADKTIADGDNAYILAGGANGTAFYKGTVGTTLKANKAYLTLDVAGGEAISMNFGGNVTGINQLVNAEQNNAPVYDLTGRRVVRTVKGGLYIKGGNKFIAR
ncbi:hypothetical protein [Prevotellamassilia timonensis]|uniref:hypothetical protein n=1 Tax=Prevotellamassilia timonensis TaxID=1852370 RepID=UPI0023F21937|nr:hypothetical protein [Prevotellamassilia timonensis]MDD7439541.1 hypothetical protein [Prevotellamassilia timonensis]